MAGPFRNPRGGEHHDAPDVEQFALVMETAMDRLIAELRPSDRGIELDGARAVVVAGGDAKPRAASSRGILVGFSFLETSGTDSATVILRDGNDATGIFLAAISLGPGESERDLSPGVQFNDGLFADITGKVIGAVYLHRG